MPREKSRHDLPHQSVQPLYSLACLEVSTRMHVGFGDCSTLGLWCGGRSATPSTLCHASEMVALMRASSYTLSAPLNVNRPDPWQQKHGS